MVSDVASSLHSTVASRVAEQLRSEIRVGELAPGAPLRQNDVAARMGVSSTPVREAFQMLERAGLVQREGRRGVRGFSPTIEDLVCSYEIRAALEPLAARRAASRVTDSVLAVLRDLTEQLSGPAVVHDQFTPTLRAARSPTGVLPTPTCARASGRRRRHRRRPG